MVVTVLAMSPVESIGARVVGAVLYAGNLTGALCFAALFAPVGLSVGLCTSADGASMSHHLTDFGPWVILGSAVTAGWMMGLVSWLATASRETTAQILMILLVTGSIFFLHLHHSIAGSVEMLMGVLVADVPLSDYLRFPPLATLGNALGGSVFVAGLKYGHISGAAPQPRRAPSPVRSAHSPGHESSWPGPTTCRPVRRAPKDRARRLSRRCAACPSTRRGRRR